MKGKIFNTDALLTALLGNRTRKHQQPLSAAPSLLTQSLMRSRRPELLSAAQPTYYSVTACIH